MTFGSPLKVLNQPFDVDSIALNGLDQIRDHEPQFPVPLCP